MKYYLGIDGGGTKTTAAVADETGNIILKVVGKSINFYSVGMATARNNLAGIAEEIKTKLGNITFECAFIGCSALDGEADSETTASLCDGVIDAEKISMNSDLFVALKASKGNCVAVCGTGSMVVGEKSNGEIIVAGGWGHIFGDEGSAYSIAINGLRLCAMESDKKETPPLLQSALDFFKVTDFRKAIDIIYSTDTSKDMLASFAEKIGALAKKGDAVCKKIIVDEACAFSETVITLIKELGECDVLSLYGGVFENNLLFREIFTEQITHSFPQIKVEMTALPPEEGAIIAARELQ